ncbi:FAD:protein FMN transferase [Nocardioides islandensis]|uniref:FAD:protein FMN transferase n=1 Tax=Nocardioides islandensis TaxID=433663 RepID=A0A930YLB6_9ACTN|nr:FAD:protein FMN transferase [Nocardioides islandensis]MBF4764460.1 FAD:protein FMN transferase [Nocardioides islandensis]
MSRTHAGFVALGTDVYLAVRDNKELGHAIALARTVLQDVDAVASRFRADSDLTAVNAAPGRWVTVDPLLVGAVDAAVAAAEASGGMVSPLLGRPLVALGYDRDFALLAERRTWPEPVTAPPPLDAWREIRTDAAGRVRIPAGTALDLGSIGKAWAADLVAAAYEQELRSGAIVSVGGDLRIAHPDDRTWAVALSEGPGGRVTCVVHLDRGGLATSSTRVRRWGRPGARLHHVLDPRTGLPAPETWHSVSATGDTCAAANTATTAAVVLGADAPAWLDAHAVTARLVSADGAVRRTGGWPLEGRAA